MILYLFQKESTGARSQAEVLAESIDDVVLMQSTPIGVENPDSPIRVDEAGIVYPTHDLLAAITHLDPSLVFVHVFNQHVVDAIGEVETCYPTVMRAGVNLTEGMFSGTATAMGLGVIVQTLQSFDHLVAPSRGTKRDLIALGIDAERITHIPTAIPMDLEVMEPPQSNAPMSVGCLSSRISGLKNQHTLVLAMSALRSLATNLNVNLFLTGGPGAGYQEAVNQMVSALGLDNRVGFLGNLDDPVSDFWPRVGIHCLPSYSERLSSSVLEGARAGVPTILSDNSWAEEFDTMLTAPPDDPVAWAEHIRELLTNDAYQVRVAREQQAEVKEHFGTDTVVPMYDEVFDDVVDHATKFKTPGRAIHQ